MQIYQILNKITGKSYVGKSKDYKIRFSRHKKAAKDKVNRRLYDSMNYHGFENFELILLEDVGDVNRKIANDKEIYWIAKLNTLMPNGYNMTPGGDGGDTLEFWTFEEKRKLWDQQAEARNGQKRTEEQCKNMSDAAIIRESNKTEEQKLEIAEKISNTNKEKGIEPPEQFKWKLGQVGAFTGKTHTPESRLLISEAREGKTYEELYGEEVAAKQRKDRSEKFKGSNNPKYVHFAKETKLQILNYMLDNLYSRFSDLTNISNISEYKIREFFRKINIENFQKFRTFDKDIKIEIIIKGIDYVNKN